MKKLGIEQLNAIIREINRLQGEHPKATIYYHCDDGEIRITYPIPRDFANLKGIINNPPNY